MRTEVWLVARLLCKFWHWPRFVLVCNHIVYLFLVITYLESLLYINNSGTPDDGVVQKVRIKTIVKVWSVMYLSTRTNLNSIVYAK